MINTADRGHGAFVGSAGLTLGEERVDGPGSSSVAEPAERLRALVETHYEFVWRSLRRLGVPSADVDDGAQQVFTVASRKLSSIVVGSERPFLFQTSLRVAADSRRTLRRRREVAECPDESTPSDRPSGEDLLDLRRAREKLDRILDGMSMELRAVFVLFELEEMTMAEIAELLKMPAGTVASRLRRARADFRQRLESMPERRTRGGAL